MALLHFDGFDHLASGDLGFKYQSVPAAAIGTGRNGNGLALTYPGFDGYVRKTLAASASGTTAILGCAFLFTSNMSGTHGVLSVLNSGTHLFTCAINSANRLAAYRGDARGTLLATATTVLTANVWYFIEMKVVLASGATGSYELRINEATELTGSSVQTSPSSTTWDTVQVGQTTGTTGTHRHDDVYACDASGTTNNDFLGDCLVETRLPSTDAVAIGSNVGLTPSTGTDHGALVDESTPNTSDYNYGTSVGSKDTYNYPDLTTTGGTVRGVAVHLFAAKANPGTRSICPVVRHGGVDYDGTSKNPGQTFTYYSQLYENNPGTSAPWTISDVNSAQFGMKVSA